jgi:L-threonylcarbamoyladenylate synthase
MGVVDDAVAAIHAGRPVVMPFDTVYGLCTTAYRSDPARRLARLKGRDERMPCALVACDLDFLFECVPELRGRAGVVARAVLPGPFTLVLSNPARRFAWLAGSRPETIGVRVPDLEGDPAAVLGRVGAVAATSANLHGLPDARSLAEVPDGIREACAAVIDGGELPGAPSTVIDFSGPEPVVLREGAAPAAEALARVSALAT